MNATATQSPKIDRAFAVQCLVSMLERTTKLLTIAARGKGWGDMYTQADIAAIRECADRFVDACGLQTKPVTPGAPWPRQAIGQRRMLGELHATVSALLVACALESIAPETGDALGMMYDIHRTHELAESFVASVGGQ